MAITQTNINRHRTTSHIRWSWTLQFHGILVIQKCMQYNYNFIIFFVKLLTWLLWRECEDVEFSWALFGIVGEAVEVMELAVLEDATAVEMSFFSESFTSLDSFDGENFSSSNFESSSSLLASFFLLLLPYWKILK